MAAVTGYLAVSGSSRRPRPQPTPDHIPVIAAGKSDVVAVSQITVRPDGCDGKVPNCLPIMPGWNYMVRLYRPGAEIFTAAFPQPQPGN
jgi:hypothetical protein